MACRKVTEWIEEEISKPVEVWEERQKEKCKDYPWYDPRGWVCWIVTYFVKVVRWIVVKVGKWVVRTVCKLVAVLWELGGNLLGGLWDIVAGIFTLDWRRILDGLIQILVGAVLGLIGLLRIVFLGDLVDYIIEEINRARLREYVRGLLESKYSDETLDRIKDSIRLDHGAFGLRMRGTVYRTVLDSETPSPTNPTVPNLVILHESGEINLRALCGFDFNDEGFWNRKRYKTLKKGLVIGGFGEVDNPISEDDLNSYLSSRGTSGPAFIVLPMRDRVLDKKVSTAEDKGRELGLMMDFETDRITVTQEDHIVHNGFDTRVADSSVDQFLIDAVERKDKTVDRFGAFGQLCHPVGVGVFRFTDGLRGIASTLEPVECGLSGSKSSGVTFIDNRPDSIWKYVLIHEFGHYFGLCHTDGVNRIMYSKKQNSWWNWWLIPDIYLQGEPIFVLDEAKSVWDYIVAHFPPSCLGAGEGGGPIE